MLVSIQVAWRAGHETIYMGIILYQCPGPRQWNFIYRYYTVRSRLDRSVLLYKYCNSIQVGWRGKIAISQVGIMSLLIMCLSPSMKSNFWSRWLVARVTVCRKPRGMQCWPAWAPGWLTRLATRLPGQSCHNRWGAASFAEGLGPYNQGEVLPLPLPSSTTAIWTNHAKKETWRRKKQK